MGITFHGHHNYSPDWSMKKGNPDFVAYMDDPHIVIWISGSHPDNISTGYKNVLDNWSRTQWSRRGGLAILGSNFFIAFLAFYGTIICIRVGKNTNNHLERSKSVLNT